MRHDNNELLIAIQRKDEDVQRLREFYIEQDKKKKLKGSGTKELLKAKKQIKDKEREIIKILDQLKIQRAMYED